MFRLTRKSSIFIKCIVVLLLQDMVIGCTGPTMKGMCLRNRLIQIIYLPASDIVIYSDSIEDIEIQVCLFEDYVTAPPSSITNHPLVDFQSTLAEA